MMICDDENNNGLSGFSFHGDGLDGYCLHNHCFDTDCLGVEILILLQW